jgi:hypothetical protein
MTLVGDRKDIDPIKIKKKYGSTILEFVQSQMTSLNQQEQAIGNSKFRIPVEYKLILTKIEGEADIKLTASGEGSKNAFIVEVAKNPDKTHPNLAKHIVIKVTRKIKQKFTSFDLLAIVTIEKIKGNGKFHFHMTDPEIHKYSESLVSFICEKIENQPDYLKKVRQKYRQVRPAWRKKSNG